MRPARHFEFETPALQHRFLTKCTWTPKGCVERVSVRYYTINNTILRSLGFTCGSIGWLKGPGRPFYNFRGPPRKKVQILKWITKMFFFQGLCCTCLTVAFTVEVSISQTFTKVLLSTFSQPTLYVLYILENQFFLQSCSQKITIMDMQTKALQNTFMQKSSL